MVHVFSSTCKVSLSKNVNTILLLMCVYLRETCHFDTWLRLCCVIECVGCREFGINETMGCLFKKKSGEN